MNKRKLILIIIFILLDQIVKFFVQTNNTSIWVIKNFFSIDYTINTGASFGLFAGKNIFLIIISIVMLVLTYSLMFSYKQNKLNDVLFAMLFGGILGNLLDRIFYSYVRDFISFEFGSYVFPTFNIADTLIVISVIALVIVGIIGEKKNGNRNKRTKRKN